MSEHKYKVLRLVREYSEQIRICFEGQIGDILGHEHIVESQNIE